MLSKQNFRGWLLTILGCLLWVIGGWSSSAEAQVAFTSRFSTNDTGDIQIVGNTLLTCSAAQASPVCSTVQNATAPGTPNNSHGFLRFRAKVN